MNNLVIGMGEALWDVMPEGKKIGGAPANFAYHVSQLLPEACVVSAVGDDALGEEIKTVFREKRLTAHLATVPFPTGTVDVSLDNAGIPCYTIREGAAWDNIPFTPELAALAGRTRAICFGSLAQRSPVSRETIRRFLDAMPEDGQTLKIFDINLRRPFYTEETLRQSLEICNVLKINDEELAIVSSMFRLSDGDIPSRCRELIARFGLRLLILTCGTDGSYVFTPTDASFLETPSVTVADTVGAGDSFTAAFTAALLSGHAIPEAHRLAVDVSAFVCTCHGAMPRFPESLLARF